MNWKQFNIIRPLLYFVTGILLFYYPCSPYPWCLLSIISLITVLNYSAKNKGRTIFHIALFISLGYSSSFLNLDTNIPAHFQNLSDQAAFKVKIQNIKKTTNAFQIRVKVKSAISKNEQVIATGNAILYIKELCHLQKGMTLLIPNKFDSIPSYKNPGKFDFGAYMAHQNIFYSAFLNQDDINILQNPHLLKRTLNNVEHKIKECFQSALASKNLPLVYTLFLGNKDEMPEDQKSIFINNGLAHLLAVSGMHVGIIIILLSFITKPLKNKYFQIVICISITWLYIIITGSQIPAVRAGFMFSVYQFGILNHRSNRPLNNVFFSAFVLLAINPSSLFQVSFQLSFTAMISILYFLPKILALIQFQSKVFNAIWQLLALSISVQLLITPISIFYFHQYPLYSILNSVIATPFIIIIIWIGIVFLFSYLIFPPFAGLIGMAMDGLISLFLQINEFLNQLPFALMNKLEVSEISLVFWTIGVLGFTYIIKETTFKPQLAAACFIPLLLLQPIQKIHNNHEDKITIYDHPKSIVVDIVKNNQVFRMRTDNPWKNDSFYLPDVEKYSIKTIDEINTYLLNHKIYLISDQAPDLSKTQFIKHAIIPRTYHPDALNESFIDISSNVHKIKDKGFFTLKI